MKEFVKKLIKQLEIEKNSANNTYMNFEMNVDLGRVFGIEKSIEIVNQLTEEYNPSKTKSLEKGWVPCSERLPEDEKAEFYPDVIITDKSGVVEVAFYNNHEKEWYKSDCGYSEEYEVKKDVIAWQPLPEPYKPEEYLASTTQKREPQPNFYSERFNRVI